MCSFPLAVASPSPDLTKAGQVARACQAQAVAVWLVNGAVLVLCVLHVLTTACGCAPCDLYRSRHSLSALAYRCVALAAKLASGIYWLVVWGRQWLVLGPGYGHYLFAVAAGAFRPGFHGMSRDAWPCDWSVDCALLCAAPGTALASWCGCLTGTCFFHILHGNMPRLHPLSSANDLPNFQTWSIHMSCYRLALSLARID